ncbi:MAG: hypothetical protein EZS28_045927, partial [Streblomastix strix]
MQTTKLMRKQVMAALIKQAQLIQQQQYQTVRSVARLIGQIQYIRVQYTRGGLHITSMNREMSKRAKNAECDRQIKLSRRALIEVEWWMTQIKNNRPRNIETHKTQVMITTNASLGRWGATLQIPGEVKTDNTTACFNLTKGKAKVGLRKVIDQILLYIEEQQWEVKFRHIPGVKNTEADSLSKLAVSGDYSIDTQVQQQVQEELQTPIT